MTRRRTPTRREFLGLMGAGGIVAAAGTRTFWSDGLDAPAAATDRRPAGLARRSVTAGAAAGRALVVVELSGGNDGLSTLVPHGDPAYARLRPTTAIEPGAVLRIDDRVGLHPSLALTAPRLAVVQGIGAPDATGSHFEMSARWWAGDASGTKALRTGFLGRLCDALDDGAPITGVSLAGISPALLSEKAVTMGLPSLDDLRWLTADDAWSRNLRDGYASLAAPAKDQRVAAAAARRGLERSLALADLLGELGTAADTERDAYPSSALGAQLRTAATLLGAGAGIRVVHASADGYDTHSGQTYRHGELLKDLDEALAAFAADLERRGLTESVLVATTSEFGRRAKDNDGGTDHGTASCALLLGPVQAGVHGEAPSLTALDDDANLVPTMSFEAYYATLAEQWFTVPASDVLTGRPAPLDGVIAR